MLKGNNMERIYLTIITFMLLALTACGGGGGGGGGNGGGSNNDRSSSGFSENSVTLRSQVFTLPQTNSPGNKTANTANAAAAPQSCTYVADIYSNTGTCISPTQVTGLAQQAHVGIDNTSVPGGTRLLGGSEFSETPGQIIIGVEFDLANPTPLVTNNTLRNQYPYREQYDNVGLSTTYYKIKFSLTYNNGADTQWVTMFLASFGQPFTTSAAVTNAMANCGVTSDHLTQQRFVNADNMLPGMSFNRGDYLFCVKDNETDTCAASDFQWLDTSDNSLTSTRPTTPKTSHYLANNPIGCVNEGEDRVNFDFGPFGFSASLPSDQQFKLWSDMSHGDVSTQWPGSQYPMNDVTIGPIDDAGWVEPYYIYYYQDCSTGPCSTTTSGSQLDVTLDFDTDEMLLITDMDEDTVESQTSIGNILANIHNKTQWAFDQKSINDVEGHSPSHIVGMEVDATITVSRDIDNPPEGAIVNCPGDPEC